MKKALLIATAAMFSVSVFAAPLQLQKVRATSPVVAKMVDKAVVSSVNDMRINAEKSAVKHRIIEGGDYLYSPAVLLPKFSFWNNNVAYTNTETQQHIPAPLALAPANVPLQFVNNTYVYREDANTPSFTDWDKFICSWTLYSSPFESGVTTAENVDTVEVAYSNRGGFVYDIPVPVMDWKYGEYTYNTAEDLMSVSVNGVGEFSFDGQTITKCELDVLPASSALLTASNNQAFQIGSYPIFTGGETASYGAESCVMKVYADSFAEKFGEKLESVEVNGFGMSIGYLGVPYVLKSVTVPAYRIASKDSKVHFTVKKGSVEDNEVIYEGDVRIEATNKDNEGTRANFELVLDSEEDGVPVDYIVVDGPLFIEMTVPNDIELFAPMCAGYDSDSNMLNTLGGYSAFTMATLKGATKSTDIYAIPENLIWPANSSASAYCMPLGIMAGINAEFPELDVVYAGAEIPVSPVDYEKSGVYTVNLTKEQNQAFFFLTTTAEVAELIYVDDANLPSWVDYEIGSIERGINANGLIEVTFPVGMELSGEGDDRAAELKLSYFDKEITLRVAQGEAAGIADVEAAGNAVVEYFDIQGRKLNAAPATGLFIQKQGGKVTKVIR